MTVLGVDCGGTNLKIAWVKESGEIIRSALEPINFKRSVGQVVADIASRIKIFLSRHGASGLRNLGMGIAGEIDSAQGIVRFSPNLGWKNVPLKKLLARHLDAKVAIENDANCAAWGAYCLDAKKDCENLICLTLGTGVGGGIVLG
jgi:glucokinase